MNKRSVRLFDFDAPARQSKLSAADRNHKAIDEYDCNKVEKKREIFRFPKLQQNSALRQRHSRILPAEDIPCHV